MPPHMHPRSRMTSSLFAATVAASFLVVGLPHALPCPRTVTYADSSVSSPSSSPSNTSEFFYVDEQGRTHRRRRRDDASATAAAAAAAAQKNTRQVNNGMVQFVPTDGEAAPVDKPRECPVPKPGGFIGDMLGFGKAQGKSTSQSNL